MESTLKYGAQAALAMERALHEDHSLLAEDAMLLPPVPVWTEPDPGTSNLWTLMTSVPGINRAFQDAKEMVSA